MWGGAAAPTGWMLCDGAAANRTTFAALFAVIGETFGPGDGITTFNVPDMQDRHPVGQGPGHTLGQVGGSDNYSIDNSVTVDNAGGGSTTVVCGGSDMAHGEPKYLGLNFIIKT